MLKNLDLERIDSFVGGLLKNWESACLMNKDGELLGLHYETLSDVGTLPQAGHTALQYLKVGPGDLVLLNDPFSGGNLLSNLTLIYGMEKACEGLILIVRTGFRAKLHLGDRLDEEGLRIPPTPLAQAGQWMEPLLQAMVEHPQAPMGAGPRLRSLFEKMRRLSQSFVPPKINWSDYLNESRQEFLRLLGEIPQGETRVEQKLPGGEILRLRMEVKAEQVLFDFSGTTPSKKMGLTDAATLGACLGAMGAFFRQNLALTAATFDCLHVSAPLGSWLNSKYPTPTFRGMTEGVHRVAHLVWQALSDLATQAPVASSPASPTWISFEFEDGRRFFDCLPGGIGAHLKSEGATALHLWIRSPLVNSVEQIESMFPLQIVKIEPRHGSGGTGQFKGGDGLTKAYKLLQPARLDWLQSTGEVKGQKGADPGKPAQVSIGAEVLTNEVGSKSIPAGTVILVETAGGGGYGKIRPPA